MVSATVEQDRVGSDTVAWVSRSQSLEGTTVHQNLGKYPVQQRHIPEY